MRFSLSLWRDLLILISLGARWARFYQVSTLVSDCHSAIVKGSGRGAGLFYAVTQYECFNFRFRCLRSRFLIVCFPGRPRNCPLNGRVKRRRSITADCPTRGTSYKCDTSPSEPTFNWTPAPTFRLALFRGNAATTNYSLHLSAIRCV